LDFAAARIRGPAGWIFDAILLFALNAWIAWRLFFLEYLPNFSSVEGFWIALARYISQNWGDLSWLPWWYGGLPFQNVYVPGLHATVAAVATLAEISAARAYHFVIGMTYSLGPVTLYAMARGLGAGRGVAAGSALAFSLFSPSALLFPAFAVDIGGLFHARRLQVMTVYGEGPHVTAITLLPLAIVALQAAIARPSRVRFALASIAIAAVLLTNTPGSVCLILAVFCWLLSQPAGARARTWLTAAGAGLLAWALAAFGVPPSALGIVLENVPRSWGLAVSGRQLAASAALLALLGFLAWVLPRLGASLYMRFGLLYLLLIGALSWLAFTAGLELIPEAGRFHLEMEWAFSLAAAALAGGALARSRRAVRIVAVVAAIAFGVFQIYNYRYFARLILRPLDLSARSEYRTARWIDQHLPGRRVYVPGSTSFWLNAFTDTPQLTGCCSQANPNFWIFDVVSLLTRPSGVEPPGGVASILWLQAYGVHAMVASGPSSTEEYKDVRDLDKFARGLDELHREAGDVIYRVPQRSDSLARVVRADEIVENAPRRALDTTAVGRYVGAAQDPARPAAGWKWLNRHAAQISANLRRSDLLSIQINYLRGWKAMVNGQPRRVWRDGIGLIVVDAECEGPCEIELVWEGAPDLRHARRVSLAAILFVAFLMSFRGGGRTGPPAPPPTSER